MLQIRHTSEWFQSKSDQCRATCEHNTENDNHSGKRSTLRAGESSENRTENSIKAGKNDIKSAACYASQHRAAFKHSKA